MAEARRRRLLRRGSLPLVLHGLVEYGAGVLFILAPSLFSFDSDTATVISILLGAAIIAIGGTTDMPTALMRRLPLDSHIVLDYVASGFAIASPFIFSFTDDGAALAFFLIIGIAYLLLTVATRFRHKDRD